MRKISFILSCLIVISSAVLSACASPAPTSAAQEPGAAPATTQAQLPSATLPAAPAVTPVEPAQTAPPAPTSTAIPSETPLPTQAEPTLMPTDTPTTLPTATPIPALERVLSLQSPALRGDDVLALQEQLLLLGYAEVGAPDGVFGGMTDTAVRRFQGEHDLAVDGVVGPQTWQVLFSQQAGPVTQPEEQASFSYYRGVKDDQVELLAERLQTLGYPICTVADEFGFQIEFAVRQFQQAHALTADGIVGPKTWQVLFSEAALPVAPVETRFSFSTAVEVGSANDLAYDGVNIWLASNDFGSNNDLIHKLDPSNGMGLGHFASPAVGDIIGFDGKTYTSHLHPQLVFAHAGMLWLGGRSSASTETGTPTFAAVQTSGNLLGKPIFVGTELLELSATVDFFAIGNQAWGVANEPFVTLYQLNPSSYQVERRVTTYDLLEARSAAFDGQRLWVVANRSDESAIWAVNPLNGIASQVLGVCGDRLTYDGQWIWVARQGLAIAVDPLSLQVMGTATFKGSPIALTSDGRNQIWLLSLYNSDYFLQSLKTR